MYFEIEGAIIEKAASGDIESFEKIVEIYEKKIFNICYRFFNNTEDAQDTAQEVFIKIYRNLDKYNFKCRFSTWAHRIAINSCIDHLRRKKAEPRTLPIDETTILPDKTSPADSVIAKDMLKNVGEAISRLKEEYRTVIILRDVNGFSYQEISEITGANTGTVKSRISRGREAIRNILINDYRFLQTSTETTPVSQNGLKEVAK